MMQLNAEQQAAIAIDDSKVVSAGAGTGKTTVLTLRYLALLESGLKPAEIVAITFTRKAARELRERIEQFLADKIAAGGQQKWKEARNQLVTAPISTIHAFYSTILRRYPLEAGLEPGFRVLEEVEADILLHKALSNLIYQGWRRKCPHLALLSQVHGSGAAEDGGSLASQLRELYTLVRNRGILVEDLALSKDYRNLPRWQQSRDDYCNHVATEPQVAEQLGQRGLDNRERIQVRRALADMGEQLAAVDSPEALLACYHRLAKLASFSGSRVNEQKRFVGGATQFLKQLLSAGVVPLIADAVLAQLRELDRNYSHLKQQQNSVDYADLQVRVWKLLKGHGHVAAELRTWFKVFLVDEFQDTDRLQEKIIRLLAEENGSIPGGSPGRLFVVGDEKQSIYRFRGAEVQVFHDVRRDLTAANPQRNLAITVNYRSRRPLIDLTNKLFSQLLGQENNGTGYIQLSAARDSQQDVCAQLLVCKKEGEQTLAEAEGIQLAALIRNMVEEKQRLATDAQGASRVVRYGDIAVLLRSRTHLRQYEHQLRLAGVPYVVVGGIGFYQQPEVVDLANILRVVDNRLDRLSLVAVLRSPLFSLNDDSIMALCDGVDSGSCLLASNPELAGQQQQLWERARRIILQLHNCRHRLGPREMLEKIIALTRYREMVLARFGGLQCYANVEKLLALAEEFEQLGSRQLGEFLAWLEQAAAKPEGEGQVDSEKADAVRIMTIHASKGLEFPVVVLPACNTRLAARRGRLLLDQAGGLVFRPAWQCSVWEKWAEEERKRDVEEFKRLLYVAVTRAEDWLAVLAAEKDKGKTAVSFNNWLVDFAEGEGGSLLPQTDCLALPKRPDAAEGPFVLPPAGSSKKKFSGLAPVGHSRRTFRYFNISQFLLWKNDRESFDRSYLSRWLEFEPEDPQSQLEHSWQQEPGGAAFGSLLHRMLEELDAGQNYAQILPRLLPVYFPGAEGKQQEQIIQAATELVDSYRKQPPPMPYNDSETEMEFYWRQGDALFYGLIDRLLIAEDAVAVIDFKSNRISPGGTQRLVDYYAPQLRFYAMAAAAIFRRPARAWLQFLRLPPGCQLVEVSLTPQQLDQLEAELNQFVTYCTQPE